MASKPKFFAASLAQRFLISFAIVFPVYNPTGISIFHWCVGDENGPLSGKLAVVLALVLLYYPLGRIVFAAFRWPGLIAAAAFALLLSYEVVAHGIQPGSPVDTAQYVLLMAIVIVVTFGTSWASLMQRLTGQLTKWYVR
jgi:hypothetical protein